MSGTAFVLSDALLLTGAYAASTNSAAVHGSRYHTLYINYSPDTNSTNALNLQIDFSPDGGTTWHIYGQFTNASGTLTEQAYTIADASAGTSDQLITPVVFDIQATHLRVRALETNTPGDFGNYTATIRSSST